MIVHNQKTEVPFGFAQLPDDKKPTNCLQCGACEQVCPQQIKISELMNLMAEAVK